MDTHAAEDNADAQGDHAKERTAQVRVFLPKSTIALLEKRALATGVPRSQQIRDAVHRALCVKDPPVVKRGRPSISGGSR